jgi:hypothetical protein
MSITLTNNVVVETTSVELPDGTLAKEFALPSGSAQVRVLEVPPFLIVDTLGDRLDLVPPDVPVIEVAGIGGTKKWLPVRRGQEEYVEWERVCAEIEALRNRVYEDLTWGYGIAEWKRGDSWTDDVPKGWKFPARQRRLGKKPREGQDGRRVDFIRYTLLKSHADIEACQIVMHQITAPVRSEEAALIAELFRDEEGRETNTGRASE